MDKIRLTGIALMLCGSVFSQNRFLQNPASAYSKFLGYPSKYKVDSLGNQLKVCILPDGSECDEWKFFRGLCAKEFSYCAIKGYQTENHTASTASYAVCSCKDSSGKEIKIPLQEFMEMNGDTLLSNLNHKKRREAKN